MTDLTVLHQLTRARTALIIDMPFFGELAIRLKLVENIHIRTLAVDGRNIFYNPTFVASLSPSHIKTVLAHEVMHPVLEHCGQRRGDRDPRRWNIAADYVVNPILKDSGFEPVPNWLYDKQYLGMTVEHIYSLLQGDGDAGGSSGNGSGGAGGLLQDGGGGSGGPDPLDEILMGADPSEDTTTAIDWKIATIQAAMSAKAQGHLPGALKRFCDELTSPKVDWREKLRRFITEVSKNDYTWTRPNRRFIAHGLYLPSLYSEHMGLLVDAIDTSGSINDVMLKAFGSEIIAAYQASSPEGLVNIYCDAAVNHVDTYGPHDLIEFEPHGGGGTNFCPPFAYVEEHGLHPACFIYLTDGYGKFPDQAPDYPVLWCMTTDVVAPWGETVKVEV